MIRHCFWALLTLFVVSLAADCEDPLVAPAPREIRPDGSREPVPAVPAKSQNPIETVERIIKNSKEVGDKLANTDTGMETRKTQEQILKDIQSLIDQQDDSPKKGDQGQDKNDTQKDNKSNDQKNNNGKPMSDKNENQEPKNGMPPDAGMPPDSGMPPMGGNDQQKGRKPRQQQNGEQPKQKEDQAKDPGHNSGGSAQNKDTKKNPMQKEMTQSGEKGKGKTPKPMATGTVPPSTTALPPEESAVKDVWGYLPDKMRQQAMQYYKQEFMPRYAKMLEHYYSSLSEKNVKK